jgi:hypothetical protein
MPQVIHRMQIALWALTGFVLIAMGQTALCQEPGPPPPGPMETPPSMNVDKQLSKMTKRYGLSDAQKAQSRPILAEEKKKMDALFQDSSLSPEDRFDKMRAIREDEVARISPMLSDEQRAKYEKDQKQMVREDGDQPPDGPPPPPPDGHGGAPPPSN